MIYQPCVLPVPYVRRSRVPMGYSTLRQAAALSRNPTETSLACPMIHPPFVIPRLYARRSRVPMGYSTLHQAAALSQKVMMGCLKAAPVPTVLHLLLRRQILLQCRHFLLQRRRSPTSILLQRRQSPTNSTTYRVPPTQEPTRSAFRVQESLRREVRRSAFGVQESLRRGARSRGDLMRRVLMSLDLLALGIPMTTPTLPRPAAPSLKRKKRRNLSAKYPKPPSLPPKIPPLLVPRFLAFLVFPVRNLTMPCKSAVDGCPSELSLVHSVLSLCLPTAGAELERRPFQAR